MDTVKRIQFQGYKSFKELQEIRMDNAITVLIGKNNSGKSSILDIIEYVYDADKQKRADGLGQINVGFELDETHMEHGFRRRTYGGGTNLEHYEYGKRFVGNVYFYKLAFKRDTIGKEEYRNLAHNYENSQWHENWNFIAGSYSRFADDYKVLRINAERNISPESVKETRNLNSNGVGATDLVRRFINSSSLDENLVQQKILESLNEIMEPDATYNAIKIQELGENSGNWEVFLEEKDGSRYALSRMGSGLKTVLLVLINLYLATTDEKNEKKYIFAFEELENNLHPALQRRLFKFLYDYAIKTGNKIILTTHSHVAINSFFGLSGTVIYHVEKSGSSSIKEIESHVDKAELLSDLDARASDLLQSNGIIWVEGPSDRIYIKRWLEVFCNNEYQEGIDYQFLYYGGRLLSHYTAEDEQVENLISILKTNRNAAIVIDSDKKSKNAHLNETKRRIIKEFDSVNQFAWVTSGKEIENYLSRKAIMALTDKDFGQVGQFELFPEYIASYDKNFSGHKVEFAAKITPLITEDNSADVLDLRKQVMRLYEQIGEWNK